MFQKAQNIEKTFRHIRTFSFCMLSACALICIAVTYQAYCLVTEARSSIYILANAKALEALRGGRRENIPVEAKDHIRTFHSYFFSLDPDEKVIRQNIEKALYLADGSAKKEYDNLTEQGYYRGIIAGNITQEINTDSVYINLDTHPYSFRYYGKVRIIRPTSIVTRVLVSEGNLRETSRSDNNAHGFLIERWRVTDNRDIDVKQR